jgi:LacI family transcriptional regulator
MTKPQITIKDIARELNISVSTVSRALKNHPDISQATKNLVNDYAKTHNYKPNILALSLRMSRNNTIGIIVPEIIHYFFSTILAGIEEVAHENNFNIVVCQSNETYEKEVRCVSSLIGARVAGVLASLSKTTSEYSHYQDILDNNIELVFFDRICIELNTDRIVVDDYAGAFTATEHLIKTGCKRIAFYSSPVHLEISKNRRNGYLDALRKHNLPVDNSIIRVCDTRQEAMRITPEILNSENRPDGFFAINDHTASGILYAVKQANLRVPDDISICGFSGGDVARSSDPPLTTVEQHGYEMGRRAAKMLIDKINGVTRGQYRNDIIHSSLIVRESTKAIE